MKIAVMVSGSFIGKNLIENLKTIRDGKNRTRENLIISDIYLDEEKDADVVIILPTKKGTKDYRVLDIKRPINNKTIISVSIDGIPGEKEIVPDNVLLYRLPEIVGKWQEPNHIIAYLCNAIANDEEYIVEDRSKTIEFLFIDDFINEMLDAIEGHPHRCDFPDSGATSDDPTSQYDGVTPVPNEDGRFCYSPKSTRASIGTIVDRLESFNRMNTTMVIPELPPESLAYKLFSMYLSYLPQRKMSYPVKMSVDNRGVFSELIKTMNNGQLSINIARPGNVRGQHWHNTKWEIFIVVSGHGLIQQRKVGSEKVFNFEVRGEEMRAIIMAPGYTHNIINLEKDRDLITVMYANEQFDPNHPDTFFEIVDGQFVF